MAGWRLQVAGWNWQVSSWRQYLQVLEVLSMHTLENVHEAKVIEVCKFHVPQESQTSPNVKYVDKYTECIAPALSGALYQEQLHVQTDIQLSSKVVGLEHRQKKKKNLIHRG